MMKMSTLRQIGMGVLVCGVGLSLLVSACRRKPKAPGAPAIFAPLEGFYHLRLPTWLRLQDSSHMGKILFVGGSRNPKQDELYMTRGDSQNVAHASFVNLVYDTATRAYQTVVSYLLPKIKFGCSNADSISFYRQYVLFGYLRHLSKRGTVQESALVRQGDTLRFVVHSTFFPFYYPDKFKADRQLVFRDNEAYRYNVYTPKFFDFDANRKSRVSGNVGSDTFVVKSLRDRRMLLVPLFDTITHLSGDTVAYGRKNQVDTVYGASDPRSPELMSLFLIDKAQARPIIVNQYPY